MSALRITPDAVLHLLALAARHALTDEEMRGALRALCGDPRACVGIADVDTAVADVVAVRDAAAVSECERYYAQATRALGALVGVTHTLHIVVTALPLVGDYETMDEWAEATGVEAALDAYIAGEDRQIGEAIVEQQAWTIEMLKEELASGAPSAS